MRLASLFSCFDLVEANDPIIQDRFHLILLLYMNLNALHLDSTDDSSVDVVRSGTNDLSIQLQPLTPRLEQIEAPKRISL